MKVINLFAGPGAGKSTTRALLFFLMKQHGMNVEEVTEYAKDVTWEGTHVLLSDQLFVLANQNRRLARLENKVDVAISDSPLLLTIQYKPLEYLPLTFNEMTLELWNTYDNHNYFINRAKAYQTAGRSQTEAEAKVIDIQIKELLNKRGIPFTEIEGTVDAAMDIFTHHQQLGFLNR